jgi:uncharacterized membrane protein
MSGTTPNGQDEDVAESGGQSAAGASEARPMGGALSGARDYTAVNPGGSSAERENVDDENSSWGVANAGETSDARDESTERQDHAEGRDVDLSEPDAREGAGEIGESDTRGS